MINANKKKCVSLCVTLLFTTSMIAHAASVEWIGEKTEADAKLLTAGNKSVVKPVNAKVVTAATALPADVKPVTPKAKTLAEWSQEGYKILASDNLLSTNLTRWCKKTPDQCSLMKYDAVDDVRIEANADFGNNFVVAINGLFDAINNHTKESRFNHRLTKNGVLLITSENN